MRLIDADELKKYISNMPLTNASKEMFKNAINAQPTAYDIDKVVEELRNQMPFCPTNSFSEGAESALLDAIDIVKQGVRKI